MTHAERVTRDAGTNFYYALRLLGRQKREAMYALYAFCRALDDCVDEPDGGGEAGLAGWVEELDRCYAGCPSTLLGQDLTRALVLFPIPRAALDEVVVGCRMDLSQTRYATYDELESYCRKVASAVGLASIEIFGYTRGGTREFALRLGLAMQITNILRDIGPDGQRGRLYLPLEDLARFGVSETELAQASVRGSRRPEVDQLLAFEGARAQTEFEAARAALPIVDRRAMFCARVMGAIYRGLLEELTARGFPVGGTRVSLSRSRKAAIAAGVLATTVLGR
jgi:15-cis-phytoene synthase